MSTAKIEAPAQRASFVPSRFKDDSVSALALVQVEQLASLLRTCADEQVFPNLQKLQQAGLLNVASALANDLEDMLFHLDTAKS